MCRCRHILYKVYIEQWLELQGVRADYYNYYIVKLSGSVCSAYIKFQAPSIVSKIIVISYRSVLGESDTGWTQWDRSLCLPVYMNGCMFVWSIYPCVPCRSGYILSNRAPPNASAEIWKRKCLIFNWMFQWSQD